MSVLPAEAIALLPQGRAAEAESDCAPPRRQRDPRDADALHLFGCLLARKRPRRDEGLSLLDRSIAMAPNNPGFLGNRAQILLQMGLVEEALRDARVVTSLVPGHAQPWLNLAQALRRTGAARESRAAAERALALDPGSAAAAYHVALIDFEGGHPAAAETGFRHVLERDPRHAGALNNLGILQRRSGRGAEALGEPRAPCPPSRATRPRSTSGSRCSTWTTCPAERVPVYGGSVRGWR